MRYVKGQEVTDFYYPARGRGIVVATYAHPTDQVLWVVWNDSDEPETSFASNVVPS